MPTLILHLLLSLITAAHEPQLCNMEVEWLDGRMQERGKGGWGQGSIEIQGSGLRPLPAGPRRTASMQQLQSGACLLPHRD